MDQSRSLLVNQAFFLFCYGGLLFLTSCRNAGRTVEPSFYHWQTKFELTEPEKLYLSNLGVHKLYVKYFDIDWDYNRGSPVPKAILKAKALSTTDLVVVPTIYITNRTFLQLSVDSLPALAERAADLISRLSEDTNFQEVQFDCDWTPKTRSKYFGFLREFRERQPAASNLLSATIRLHQLKYTAETGVPPVDRGMLMVYNVGELRNWFDENSILTTTAVVPYLRPFGKYPIDLDVALPIFSWGVVFRQNKLIRLINNLRAEHLADTSRFLKLTENRFQLKKSTYIKGAYLYEGDKVRTEAIAPAELEETANKLAPLLTTKDISLSFYHLDSTTIKYYPHEQLQRIVQIFEK